MTDNKVDWATIDLMGFKGLGLIIPHKTNVLYRTQAGGLACDHPVVEGAFIPLSEADGVIDSLYDHFATGPKWHEHCFLGCLDEEDADYLDELFQKHLVTKYLKVDRSALKSSGEAWVYVTLHYPEKKYPLFLGFESDIAVLTWQNSD